MLLQLQGYDCISFVRLGSEFSKKRENVYSLQLQGV